MTRYVALLRGINVGGHNKIKMAELKDAVMACGFSGVQHYVQSGNLVFEGNGSPSVVAVALEGAIKNTFGFDITVLVRTHAEFEADADANPFACDDDKDPKFIHAAFLERVPAATEMALLEAAHTGPEPMLLKGRTLYVYYVNGSGRSKLNGALIERQLGQAATARNWNTVMKLRAMLAKG